MSCCIAIHDGSDVSPHKLVLRSCLLTSALVSREMPSQYPLLTSMAGCLDSINLITDCSSTALC